MFCFLHCLRGHRQLLSVNGPGVCRYGSMSDCCYGWKRNHKQHCEAICVDRCKYGECVLPDTCKCYPGYTGKTCNQDINECGLKPHVCEHRCMNTHGSNKCYCLNRYMLMPDGTCSNSRTCTMVNCQYGCEEVKDDVRCLCPLSGLQLAPNEKTCIDIDECATGRAVCSFNRRCINTFGSFYCKYQIGYKLKHLNGRYDCVDINECIASTPKCNLHAECLNIQGSFKCKCKLGYRGNGFECSVAHENSVKAIHRMPGIIKEKWKKLLLPKKNAKKHDDIKNTIPASKAHVSPLDYEDDLYLEGAFSKWGESTEDIRKDRKTIEQESVEEEEGEIEHLKNQTVHEKKLRGDVFYKEAAVFGPNSIQKNSRLKRKLFLDITVVDCSFGRGSCAWQQDAIDFDWNPADHEFGDGYYMTVPAFIGHKGDVGRMKLLLTYLEPKSISCLIFSYRLAGERVEQSMGNDERWWIGQIEVHTGAETAINITFEAERGKGKTGETAVDAILLFSNLCSEDLVMLDI
ncbi:epidermal growth factor-like protein 6 [Thamnophis elegans]|uniref:epidermal growth factor-like protein 6 n=1 Tax=Thamnophis elegans TaxID=35005 RepID=UPI0013782967|nr:epidermal growth factor-like protein 6 [Thamnophis elegans]